MDGFGRRLEQIRHGRFDRDRSSPNDKPPRTLALQINDSSGDVFRRMALLAGHGVEGLEFRFEGRGDAGVMFKGLEGECGIGWVAVLVCFLGLVEVVDSVTWSLLVICWMM